MMIDSCSDAVCIGVIVVGVFSDFSEVSQYIVFIPRIHALHLSGHVTHVQV
jgi:hypothetical protein